MNTENEKRIFPFCAIVGQEDMKKALLLNIINPKIGGVLIRGEKGTAKSTAVRALAEVLPLREQVENCKFSCDPNDERNWCSDCKINNDKTVIKLKMKVVNLPVSATEDRVVGTLDIEYALKHGEKKFEPGILAMANRNILYVDEINLLDDHVVDVLLDAAAMGVNSIEREGVSYSHPSNFILVGTMNPEEGDLRPQLIDRFGLVVDVYGESDKKSRVEVIKQRLAFEDSPTDFIQYYEKQQILLGEKIKSAKAKLKSVTYSDKCLELAADICIQMGVDGHRADITLIKTAVTHAAYQGRTCVTKEDMYVAAKLALPHRMRRKPFEEGTVDFETISSIIDEYEL
ncbi:ATP-binding protein [Paludicola sp. MB14-C6]|uniref:ATP-binding protein n=1 Tax=Paludihabitans sp. MB14-C6 TaxID=3070656 RepID=UPI0035A27E7E